MALNPEEMKRRRQEAAQKRQKQQQMRKKLLRKILLAAVLAVVAIVAVIVIVAVSKPKPKAPATPDQLTTIHLAAAGDLNISDQVIEAGGPEMDYSNLFMDVAHLLADADISVVNYEGVLCGDPYGESKSAPVSMMQALSEVGVDLVQLANSYSIYNGISGLSTTIDNVRAAGMEPVGVYKSNAKFEENGGFTLCEVEGIKIAFVAFTKGMDGMALPEGSENCVNVLYSDYSSTYQKIDEARITKVLDAVKEEKPDITIALLHWGSEFNDTLSTSQQTILALLQEKGVDGIIGTHSHYVQRMELNEKTGKFVAFSLGDFVSDTQRSGSEYSVVLNLEITKNQVTGETKITGFDYTPIYTVAEEGKYMRIMRIAETMAAYEGGYINKVSDATYQGMKYALERIDKRIKGE